MLLMTMKRLQMNLKFLGYYDGNIDGIKGPKTLQGIKDFQKANNLAVDGIAGQNTIDKVRDIICDIQRTIGANVDGVAGPETISKKAEYDNRKQEYSWEEVKHFKKSEFACKDNCGFDNVNIKLVEILEKIRSHFGDKPCIITSGCRCSKHNANVGGVQGSRHVLGKAVDFYIEGVHVNDLLAYTKTLVANGTLRYTYTNSSNMNGVVHIDIQ